jgi:diaminohydroxyphosphoribosylaminopyrimidine deaminase/5-amino-6-(5-phosphoribosylamino)uracil reductase
LHDGKDTYKSLKMGNFDIDIKYMKRCLQLASYGGGQVSPNPMVGAVLVCEDKIIGEGYHQKYGKAHAEPNAINSVTDKDLLKKSTLYVNLEPCSHYGKTPPCANLIVECGVPRVVVGSLDPNPKVAGRGVEILKNAGIEVATGVMEAECRELNRRFFIFQTEKRPYITLKWAQTQDGFIDRVRKDASEKPLLISNAGMQILTHKIRSENQSILVSTNTAVMDNPSLNVRFWSGKNPIRLLIDRTGRIPEGHNVKNGQIDTIIFTGKKMEDSLNLRYMQVDFSENSLGNIISAIYNENIHSVLVEGGAQLLNSFIKKGYWDEAHVEVSPVRIGQGVQAPALNRQPTGRKTIEGHECLYFRNEYSL